ncbi:hypothetical protein D3C78_1592180 [compost metagenome]
MGIVTLGNGTELFHDVRRGWPVGVAHAEIDDILATTARSHLEFGGDVEYVRGKTFNTRETALRTIISHRYLEETLAPGPSERRWPT